MLRIEPTPPSDVLYRSESSLWVFTAPISPFLSLSFPFLSFPTLSFPSLSYSSTPLASNNVTHPPPLPSFIPSFLPSFPLAGCCWCLFRSDHFATLHSFAHSLTHYFPSPTSGSSLLTCVLLYKHDRTQSSLFDLFEYSSFALINTCILE